MIAAYAGTAAPRRVASNAASRRTAKAFVGVALVLAICLQRAVSPDGGDAGGSFVAQVIWGGIYLFALAAIAARPSGVGSLVRRSPIILLIISLALVSCLWSVDPSLTIRRALGLIGTTAVAYYAVSRLSLEEFVDVLAVVAGVIAAASLFLIVAVPDIGVMQLDYPGTWRGVFDHKNGLGLFLALAIVTVMVRLPRRDGVARVVDLGVLLLCAVELVGSQSVTSMVIVAFAIVVVAAVRFGRGGRVRRRRVIAAAVVTALSAIAFVAGGGSGTLADASLLGRSASLTGRTVIWPFVLHAIQGRPLLGFGYDVFWSDGGPYLQYLPSAIGWRPYHAHDGYLEIALDLGVVGLVLVAAMIASAAVRSLRYLAKPGAVSVWPILVVVYFVALNVTEAYIAKYNTFDWIVFVAAFLYVAGRSAERAR